MYNKKNIYYLSSLLFLFMFSCKKEGNKTTNASFSNVIVVHAIPDTPANPTVLALPIQVYIDQGKFSISAIPYLGSTVTTINGTPFYLPTLSGSNKLIEIRPDNDQNSKLASLSTTLDATKNYTFFAYDTITANKVKLLKLTDDITPPVDPSMCKVRFIHLAPNISNIDVTLLRLSTPKDSVTFPALSYVGNTPANESALSTFTSIKGVTSPTTYTVRLKNAGTQTIIKSFAGFSLANGKTYTLYVTGGVKTTNLTVKSIRHF